MSAQTSFPSVITIDDFEDKGKTLAAAGNTFECDCPACAGSGIVRKSTPTSPRLPLRCASDAQVRSLSPGWYLVYNPLHERGLALLNQAAFELWRGFEEGASTLSDGLVAKLRSVGAIQAEGVQAYLSTGVYAGVTAWIHVTNQCNLSCDYCYVDKSRERMELQTGIDAVDAVLRSASAGGFPAVRLKFAGGEATLSTPLVLKLDDYARQKARSRGLAYESAVLSNGVHISHELAQALKEREMRLAISLDGLGASHDRQRRLLSGGGTAARVTRTIDALVEKGLSPFISITVTDHNTETLADTVRFVLERGLRFNLNFVRDNAQIADFDAMRVREAKIVAAIREVFAVVAENLPAYSLLGTMIDRSNFAQPHAKACGVGESYLVIDQRGGIAKCHMEIAQTVTDVRARDPLKVIKDHPHGVRNVSVEEKEGCRSCEWRYWCGGGCPITTFKVTGRYDVKSPHCNVYKAVYPELVQLEGRRLLEQARRRGLIPDC